MKKLIAVLLVFCFGLLTACVTPPSYLLVESDPSGALIKFQDGRTCTTPCPITVDYPATITIAKAGYIAQEHPLTVGQTGSLSLTLQLAAPTTIIEETAMPDL